MSYSMHIRRSRRGFGDTTSWGHLYGNADEVYLLRVHANVLPASADDLLLFLRAFGLAQNFGLNLRGAAVQPDGADGAWIDIVGTTASRVSWWRTVSDVVASMLQDSNLRGRYSELALDQADTLQLTGPPAAVDFWRSRVVLWDLSLGSNPCGPDDSCAPGAGGPTQAYASRLNLYSGQADVSQQLVPLSGSGSTPLGGGGGSGPGPVIMPGDIANMTNCLLGGYKWDKTGQFCTDASGHVIDPTPATTSSKLMGLPIWAWGVAVVGISYVALRRPSTRAT
jgi:hypothetical protein